MRSLRPLVSLSPIRQRLDAQSQIFLRLPAELRQIVATHLARGDDVGRRQYHSQVLKHSSPKQQSNVASPKLTNTRNASSLAGRAGRGQSGKSAEGDGDQSVLRIVQSNNNKAPKGAKIARTRNEYKIRSGENGDRDVLRRVMRNPTGHHFGSAARNASWMGMARDRQTRRPRNARKAPDENKRSDKWLADLAKVSKDNDDPFDDLPSFDGAFGDMTRRTSDENSADHMRRTLADAQGKTVAERLVILKALLEKSPETVVGASDVQDHLQELEEILRGNLSPLLSAEEKKGGRGEKTTNHGVTEQLDTGTSSPTINIEHRGMNGYRGFRILSLGSESQYQVAPSNTSNTSATVGSQREETQQGKPDAKKSSLDSVLLSETGKHAGSSDTLSTPAALGSQYANTQTGKLGEENPSSDSALLSEMRGQMKELTDLVMVLVRERRSLNQQANQSQAASALEFPQRDSGRFEELPETVEPRSARLKPLTVTTERHNTQSFHSMPRTQQRPLLLHDIDVHDSDKPNENTAAQQRLSFKEWSAQSDENTAVLAKDLETAQAMNAKPAGNTTLSKVPDVKSETIQAVASFGSLYEQLFPEETATEEAQSRGVETEPSRLALPAPKTIDLSKKANVQKQDSINYNVRFKSVVRLSQASKSLTEDDFLRSLPRWKHLDARREGFERVIPVRDPASLERTGDYWIKFRNAAAAQAYVAHCKKLWNFAKQHARTSLLSELPAVPKTSFGGEVVDEVALAREFTLVAPTMPLNLTYQERDYKIESVLAKGAYPQALAGGLTPDTPQVLLKLYAGNMPNYYQLRDAIAKDGSKMHGRRWDHLPGRSGIRKLEIHALSLDRSALLRADDSDPGLGQEELDAMDLEHTLPRYAQDQRWLIAFHDREEAQRFARYWNARDFPWAKDPWVKDTALTDVDVDFKSRTKVQAEMLWC